MNTYTLRTDQLIDQQGHRHTVYGIDLIDPDNLSIAQTIPDIFCDLPTAQRFLDLINRLGLSPLHLIDAVSDTIC